MMSGAKKPCSYSAKKGQRYFYRVITLLTLIGSSAKKMSFDCEGDKIMGYHCQDEPNCIRVSYGDKFIHFVESGTFLCEDTVLIFGESNKYNSTYDTYEMVCLGETEGDPYDYLSTILSTHISLSSYNFPNSASLAIRNCSAPSRNLSVLFGGGSTGFIGGARQLPLFKLTIDCKHEKTRQFSMHHWSGLKQLEEIIIICRKLSEVEEDLLSWISKRLKHLQIIDTEIRYFPEGFFSNMESMEKLVLRRNKLRSFRRSFLSNMRNLKRLFLGTNEIEILDDDIFLQTENLIHLELEKNSLTALPTSVCSLRNLIILNAGYNRISFIPKECFYSLLSLRQIYLNGNRLLTFGLASESILPNYNKNLSSDETFPNSSSTLEQPRNLNNTWIGSPFVWELLLDNNFFTYLPEEALYRMEHLEYLSISRNNISHLPENIFSRNKHLRHLLASNNLLTHIPAKLLENNTGLRKLDLSHNLIETLHEDFFSNSIKLCHIDISDNRIRRLPHKIFQTFKAQKGRYRCYEFVLDMSRNSLEDVPELSISKLAHLDLSENLLTLIKPEVFSQTPHLLEVNLSHNLIHTTEISGNPYKFKHWDLTELKVIDLSSNQLTKFHSMHYNVPNLKHLNISNNNITEFSIKRNFRRFKLEALDMSLNRSKSVDFDWFNIKHLDLSHNGIDLEDCTEYMDPARLVWGCYTRLFQNPELEVIILSHNRIAYIPMDFQHYMPNLRYVDLSHNKIKRLWYGDLLYTRARDNMDLEWFRTSYKTENFRYPLHNYLPKDRFPGSKNLTIDLRHNSISSLHLPDDKIKVVFPGCDIGSQFSRVKLLLGHNPFVCDCEVFKLLRYASLEMRPTSALERLNGHMLVLPAVIDIEDLHCWEPDSMKGKAIADVESWAFHWLPMIGTCLNHLGVQSKLGKTSAKSTKAEAMDEPPT